MRIAVVGTGIAGNVVAWQLAREHELTVYEAADRVGGHTHTHALAVGGREVQVDSGFIVFNDWTYPNFVRLLDTLGVASQRSPMSFSVRDDARDLEYNGSTLGGLFVQRRNLLRPGFYRMLRDVLRFNREAPRLLATLGGELPLGEYLAAGRYSREFIAHYLVPMGAAIWSTEPAHMLGFPARFFVRFLHNHGMLSVDDRPTWRVVQGGSMRYVEKLTAGFRDRIRLRTPVEQIRRSGSQVVVKARGAEPARFDAVFLACHSDQALGLLADPSVAEREVLGAIRYQRNSAVLHTDTRVLPRRRRAWAAWNYHVDAVRDGGARDAAAFAAGAPVTLTYHMNILQSLDTPEPLLVTLNRDAAIDPARVLARVAYEHPLFTPAGVAAQGRHAEISGPLGTYYCGAYWRYGFHEDGVVSALAALEHFHARTGHAQRPVFRAA